MRKSKFLSILAASALISLQAAPVLADSPSSAIEYVQLSDNDFAEGDPMLVESDQSRPALMANGTVTEVSVTAFVSEMLSKVGKAYSQSLRYQENYYDCSSLVQRSLNALGVYGNVPMNTYDWYMLCKDKKIGDVITLGNSSQISFKLIATNVGELSHPEYFTVPGTLMVLIEQGQMTGHIAVSLGSYARQDAGLSGETDMDAIALATEDYVRQALVSNFGADSTLLSSLNAYTGTKNLAMDEAYMGSDVYIETDDDGNRVYSGTYNPIWRVEAFNSKLGILVDNKIKGTRGTNCMFVLQPVSGSVINSGSSEITGAAVSNVSADGYTINVSLKNAQYATKISAGTWTESEGQDDLNWQDGSIDAANNAASLYIKTNDHENQSGHYISHVYLYSTDGSKSVVGLDVEVPEKPAADKEEVKNETETLKINTLTVSDVSVEGYRVTASVEASAGVERVLMPTWTESNDQDDLIWYYAEVIDGTASLYISTKDHNYEAGRYYTHVYAYDNNGNFVAEGREIEVPGRPANSAVNSMPVINSVASSSVTSSGYTVTAVFSAEAGVREVLMPTWTNANGQDDLIWHRASVIGNSAVFNVSSSNHNNETGTYTTHVYVTDVNGRTALQGIQITVPGTSGSISGTVRNGIDYSPVFDAAYYSEHNPDLKSIFGSDENALFEHFIESGMAEGRQASANFNATVYQSRYPDLEASFGDNMVEYYLHYLTTGRYENRSGK